MAVTVMVAVSRVLRFYVISKLSNAPKEVFIEKLRDFLNCPLYINIEFQNCPLYNI